MADTDFEVEIGAGAESGEFVVRVLRAPVGGEPIAELRLDIDGWLARRDALENAVLLSAVAARRRTPATEQPLREAGLELFETVFAGEVGSVYRASLATTRVGGRKLRVVLRLTEPRLAVLPWEALYDPERRSYVCRREEVVRHVPAPYTVDPLPVQPPLRILGLVAAPRNLQGLDSDTERKYLQQALTGPITDGRIELVWAEPASWATVHERLLREPWHVVHFIGHGDYDTDSDEGQLALVGDDGRDDWVGSSRLVDLLDAADPTPRLVVLNSCASGQGGTADLLSGTAATLVHSGISAVAAMQFTITDRAAVAFPRGFYTALAAGRGVDEAVRAGRVEILGVARDTLEWVTPVLYVRGNTTRLFDLAAAPRTPTRPDHSPATQGVDLADDPAWGEALEAFHSGRWQDAATLLGGLQGRHPGERRVADKLDQARQQHDLVVWFDEADAAMHEQRWDAAVATLERVVAVDPGFRDAAARLEQARRGQQRQQLLDELVALHHAGRWQAVVEAGDRLSELDPTAVDPDGRIADARRHLADADLADRYRRAIDLLDRHQWQAAADLLEAIAREEPGYRNTTALLVTAHGRLEPATEQPASPSPTSPQPPPKRAGGPRTASDQVARRAERLAAIIAGARVLLVNDVPDDMSHVIAALRTLDIKVDTAVTTEMALSMLKSQAYDAVISDMRRGDQVDAGVRLIAAMRESDLYCPTILTPGRYQPELGTPPFAFGITPRFDELLNLLFDSLERTRG